jgi:hypothetical protein
MVYQRYEDEGNPGGGIKSCSAGTNLILKLVLSHKCMDFQPTTHKMLANSHINVALYAHVHA